MVDLASLALKVDSSEVKSGVSDLDRLTAAGTKAEGAVDRLGDIAAQTGTQLRTASHAASEMAAKAQASAAAATGMGNSSKLASHHVQNLAFQANDLFVGLLSGQKPMTVFMQQGTQIAQIMGQAGIGVGGLAKQVGGLVVGFARAHPILLAIAAAAGLATGAFQLFQHEVKKTGELQAFVNTLGLTKKEMKELGPITVTFTDYLKAIWQELNALLGTDKLWKQFAQNAVSAFKVVLDYAMKGTAAIYAGFAGTFDAIGILWKSLPGIIGEGVVAAANLVISILESMVNRAIALLTAPVNFANGVLKAAGMPTVDAVGPVSFGRIDGPKGTVRATGADMNAAYGRRFVEAYNGQRRFLDNVNARAIDNAEDRYRKKANQIIADRGPGPKGRSGRDVETDYEKAIKEAEAFIAALEKETAAIGKSAIELKKKEVQLAMAKAPTDALKTSIMLMGAAWEDAMRKQADKAFQDNVIKPLEDELKLLGLVGPEREKAALALEKEAFIAKLVKDGVTDANAAWEKYLNLRTQIINGESALEKDRIEAERLKGIMDDVLGQLAGMGGVGGTIGGILQGLQRGSFSNMGPAGALADIILNPTIFKAQGAEIAKSLEKVFGIKGEFGKTMATLLQGAAVGSISGSLLGSKGSGLGSAIGGALGEKLGEKFLSKGLETIAKGLGDFAGPLGGIIGGLLGGALIGALKSTPRGSATIGGVDGALGVTGTSGNSKARIAASTKGANVVIDSLASIADRLGVDIDAALGSVSIGIRDKDYRVDPTGKGITKTKRGAIDFGEDAEAAVQFAIMDLIKDGVLVGLRKGTETLLKNAKDLELGLTKALKFEGVFDDLQSILDPMGFALGQVTKEFESLRKIFTEAGASAEEFAQLEELLAYRKEAAQLDALTDKRNLEIRILELTGRETEAVAAARELELMGLTASLRPLQQMIYTLEDAHAVIDKFSPLADDLKDFRAELLGGGDTRGSLAFLRSQFRSTADLASRGDAKALGMLRGVSTDYLDGARNNARSRLEFENALGEVLASVDQGIFAADAQIEYAQLQIDAIKANTTILQSLRTEMTTASTQIAENTSKLTRLWERYDGDGLTIKTDTDTPLQVEVVS